MVGRIYKEEYYILLYTKHKSSQPGDFREHIFIFPYDKSMGANDPVVGPILILGT